MKTVKDRLRREETQKKESNPLKEQHERFRVERANKANLQRNRREVLEQLESVSSAFADLMFVEHPFDVQGSNLSGFIFDPSNKQLVSEVTEELQSKLEKDISNKITKEWVSLCDKYDSHFVIDLSDDFSLPGPSNAFVHTDPEKYEDMMSEMMSYLKGVSGDNNQHV